MLVLSRKQGERVIIGGDIVVTVIEARDGRVKLGFEAPHSTPIHRVEVLEKIARSAGSASDASCREGLSYVECG